LTGSVAAFSAVLALFLALLAPVADAAHVRRHGLFGQLGAAASKVSHVGSSLLSEATQPITQYTTTAALANPNTPVLVTDKTKPPAGYRLTADQVEAIAARAPKVVSEIAKRRAQGMRLVPYEYTKGPGRWQVSWFTPPGGKTPQKEIIQAYVDDSTGTVTAVWTGFQVAWTMARGYPGAFGRVVNSWWLWVPLCLVFFAPFFPWRRRPTLWHLDLAMLLFFSVSIAFFNHANVGMSVPLTYPPLLYFLARLLLLAAGKGRAREPLRILVPVSWLIVGTIFLVGFRVGLNIANSNVIDVGYAGVIGADKLIHHHKLYGDFPSNNPNGDTYGPVNYYTYIPAVAVFGWSGNWDNLPAAHAAAIAFDLLTLVGLFFLGRRIRGPSTGVVLAYLWAAYPFTLFTLSSNSNDSLVACLLVLCLLVITWAPVRGFAAAVAGFTKFAPLALGPLFMRGESDWPRRRSIIWYMGAYALTTVLIFLPIVLDHNLKAFWDDSIKYQANRPAPFSIWGLWGIGGTLNPERHIVQGLAIGLALIVPFFPRKRTIVEVAALGAAVIIALQLSLTYWFYLYIPWFFPLLVVAIVCSHPFSSLHSAVRAYATGDLDLGGTEIVNEPDPVAAVALPNRLIVLDPPDR
jgi:hypothetical protein